MESGCNDRTFDLSNKRKGMKLITRLQELAIKTILICFMIIVAIPAKGISYFTDSIKKSSKAIKIFLILSIILTGELPPMNEQSRECRPAVQLVIKNYTKNI